jgi:histidinol dehydrogenase
MMVKKIKKGFNTETLLGQFDDRGFSVQEVTDKVASIIEAVKTRGDEALYEFCEKFDGVKQKPGDLTVDEGYFKSAGRVLDDDLYQAIETAVDRIRRFHQEQSQRSWFIEEPGGFLGQQIRPIENVGVYAPGGTAVLFSTAIMNIIPAQVAGCKRIAVASPPQASLAGSLNPATLAVCGILDEKEIYLMGGAQAIAALALGTETVKKVDMICGPGNIYVNEAKRQLQGTIRIDSLAGPTEVIIIADSTARADFIAADLLAQLEHDIAAAAMLLTPDENLIQAVEAELLQQKDMLNRKEIISQSIENNCYLVHTENLQEAIETANQLAPEHLELLTRDALNHCREIQNAGAIFIGNYAPEAIGDYIAGPNHVLPTNRTARFSSGLSVDDFIKKSSLVYFERMAFEPLANAAMLLAQAEGLDGHANSVRVRL